MPKPQRKDDILKSELPPALPLMALRSTIVYPLGTIAVQMGAPENLALLRANEEPGLIVALVVASGDHDEPIESAQFIGRVGVAARVHERINLPGDTVQITLQGLRRIVVEEIRQTEPFVVAAVKPAKETISDPKEIEDLVARVAAAAETLADLIDRIPDEVPAILKMNVSDPGRFADLASTNMNFRISDKDEVLQRLDVGQRLRFILTRLEREVARARVMEDVKRQTEIKIEQHQREFYLRQQLRAIQTELGEADPGEKETIDTLKKIDEANLPEKVGTGSAARDRAHAHALARVERVPGHPHVPRLDPRPALAQALGRRGDRARPRSSPRSTAGTTDCAKPRSASSSSSPSANSAAAIRTARFSASSDRQAPARPRSAKPSPAPSAASSTASRWAACATKRRSAATGARTSVRCPD